MLDLSALRIVAGTEAHLDTQGLTLSAPAEPGAYSAYSPPIRSWCRRLPAVLEIEIEATAGAVGVVIASPDLGTFISGERRVTPEDGRQIVRLYAPGRDAKLLFRNHGTSDQRPMGTVFRIEALDKHWSAQELREIRVHESNFWYYSMDLGNGIKSVSPFPMEGHIKGRAIMHWVLDRHFGGIKRKTVLEPGCSGGFHSVELARRGSILTAFDQDETGLLQARLAAECLGLSVKFHHAEFYTFMEQCPVFDIVYCSGLLYHLPDPARAVRLIGEKSRIGAVLQTSISDLAGEVLEFANADKYAFSVPRGEFAFVPSSGVLPRLFEGAGFEKYHMFDLSEFTDDIEYVPTTNTGALGPIYAALLK